MEAEDIMFNEIHQDMEQQDAQETQKLKWTKNVDYKSLGCLGGIKGVWI